MKAVKKIEVVHVEEFRRLINSHYPSPKWHQFVTLNRNREVTAYHTLSLSASWHTVPTVFQEDGRWGCVSAFEPRQVDTEDCMRRGAKVMAGSRVGVVSWSDGKKKNKDADHDEYRYLYDLGNLRVENRVANERRPLRDVSR